MVGDAGRETQVLLINTTHTLNKRYIYSSWYVQNKENIFMFVQAVVVLHIYIYLYLYTLYIKTISNFSLLCQIKPDIHLYITVVFFFVSLSV